MAAGVDVGGQWYWVSDDNDLHSTHRHIAGDGPKIVYTLTTETKDMNVADN